MVVLLKHLYKNFRFGLRDLIAKPALMLQKPSKMSRSRDIVRN